MEPAALPWRRMGMRRVLGLLAVAILAAGCSSGHTTVTAPTSTTRAQAIIDSPLSHVTVQQRADRACKTVAPHDLVSALPTTVGAIRAIVGGTPVRNGLAHPYTWLLPRTAPDSAFAAWCWRRPTPKHYVLYVVGPNGGVKNAGQGSEGGPPPGPGPLQVT